MNAFILTALLQTVCQKWRLDFCFLAGDLTSVKRVVFLSSASDMKSWLLLLPASAFSALWGLMRKRETSSQGHNRDNRDNSDSLVWSLPLRSEPMQRDQHASVTRADAHGNIPSTVLGTVGFCFTTSSVEAIHQPSRAWSGKKQYRSYKHVVQLTQSQRDRGERRKEK